jgi:hypothetical protein
VTRGTKSQKRTSAAAAAIAAAISQRSACVVALEGADREQHDGERHRCRSESRLPRHRGGRCTVAARTRSRASVFAPGRICLGMDDDCEREPDPQQAVPPRDNPPEAVIRRRREILEALLRALIGNRGPA